ncbi:MAG: glycosyltransferase family 2 protein [Leifsonia sp.]|uniref:glycosyltransferase family 2 protein n=1 Tax=Leifsonia sp. TaxID=1870902 RepID=UPI003F7FF50B
MTNDANTVPKGPRRPKRRDVIDELVEEQRRLREQIAALTALVQSTVVSDLRGVDTHLDIGLTGIRESAAAFEGEVRDALERVGTRLKRVEETVERNKLLLHSGRDATASATERLELARSERGYGDAWTEENPLVTVRIATYQRTHELMTISLPSVLAQTHENIEVLIVNDGPNPETEAAVRELGDPRVNYSAFPHRWSYPKRRSHRWFVAGSPGMNEGIRRAAGLWVAPLDEDDAFEPDHIERLLALARASKAEVAYGALIQHNQVDGSEARIFSWPPERGGFSFQGALVHGRLRFFQYDQESWLVDEPGDWNLARRMLAAGVRFAAEDEIVGRLNWTPYSHK